MSTKYRHLSDQELTRLVRYDHGDLVEELCDRLEQRYTPKRHFDDEKNRDLPDYREYPSTC